MDTRQHETNRDAFSAVASELRASQCANRLKAARNIAFDAYSELLGARENAVATGDQARVDLIETALNEQWAAIDTLVNRLGA